MSIDPFFQKYYSFYQGFCPVGISLSEAGEGFVPATRPGSEAPATSRPEGSDSLLATSCPAHKLQRFHPALRMSLLSGMSSIHTGRSALLPTPLRLHDVAVPHPREKCADHVTLSPLSA